MLCCLHNNISYDVWKNNKIELILKHKIDSCPPLWVMAKTSDKEVPLKDIIIINIPCNFWKKFVSSQGEEKMPYLPTEEKCTWGRRD